MRPRTCPSPTGFHVGRVRLRRRARHVLDDDHTPGSGPLDVNLDRKQRRALLDPQVGESRQPARARREALPEDLVRPLAGRRLGARAREHCSNGRRDREDVVAETLQDERLLHADRVRGPVLVEPDDDALAVRDPAEEARLDRQRPGNLGRERRRLRQHLGRPGQRHRAGACRGRCRQCGRAEPEHERPPAQRRCSIGTSVADRGSSLTGLYVMPSNFAK
jgi:hypothetical protein